MILSFGCTLSSSSTEIFGHLAVDQPADLDAAIRAALVETAGQRDRLLDRDARIEHEVAGIADHAGDVECCAYGTLMMSPSCSTTSVRLAELEILAVHA